MSARVGIVAALAGEIKPLVESWERLPLAGAPGTLFRLQTGGTEYLAIAGGMGARAAARAVESLFAHGPLTHLVSAGWAGGLSCGVQTGTAYRIDEVIEPRTGERFETELPASGRPRTPLRLVTSDHIVMRAEKSVLGERYEAAFVDMEAATVARLAAAHGVSFACWKAIADRATDELPDLNRFLDKNGQLSLPRLLSHISVRPRTWAPLRDLGRNSTAGALALKEALTVDLMKGNGTERSDASSN